MKEELRTQLESLLQNQVSGLQELLGGLQNRLFSFHTNGVKLVVRLSSPKRRSQNQLEAELSFVEMLQRNEIQTVQPYKLNGKAIFTIKIKEHPYLLTLFEFIEGKTVDVMNPSQWNETFFRRWGETIAQMHKTAMNLEDTFSRPVFIEDRLSINVIPSLLKNADQWYVDVYESVMHELTTVLRTPENFGLIHNDLH